MNKKLKICLVCFLFSLLFSIFYIPVLTFLGLLFTLLSYLPYIFLENAFGVLLSIFVSLIFLFIYFFVFLWKIPRFAWRKNGFKNKYYGFLPIISISFFSFLGVLVPEFDTKFDTHRLLQIQKEPATLLASYSKAAQAYFSEHGSIAKSSRDLGKYITISGCQKNNNNFCRKNKSIDHTFDISNSWYSPSGYYEITMKTTSGVNLFIAKPSGKYSRKLYGVSSCFNSKNGKTNILKMETKGTNVEIASCSVLSPMEKFLQSREMISPEEMISPREIISPEENTILDLQIKYQEHFSKSREIESNFLDCYNSAENENNPVLSLEMKNKCQAERFKTREIFNKELDNTQDEIDKLNNP